MIMQLTSRITNRESAGEQAISCAVLRDDGQIHFELDGQRYRAAKEPADAVQIAMSHSGLWCLTSKGIVFRLRGAPGDCNWDREKLKCVKSIGTLPDGRFCAVTKRKVFRFDGDCTSIATADTKKKAIRWREDPAAAEWMGVKRSYVAKYLPRFTLRTLVCLITVFAALIGPVSAYRSGVRQVELLARLKTQHCTFQYAHQRDADGNEIESPKLPGPAVLRRVFGDRFFYRPVRLETRGMDMDWSEIARLKSLREVCVSASYASESFDLASLVSLKELSRLEIKHRKLKSLPKLSEMRNLKHLCLEGCGLPSASTKHIPIPGDVLLDAVQSMQLESLEATIVEDVDLERLVALPGMQRLHRLALSTTNADLMPLTRLAKLEHLRVGTVRSLRPFRQLPDLKSLELDFQSEDVRLTPRDLRYLTKLQSLKLTHCSNLVDLDWLSGMSELRQLSMKGSNCADVALDPLRQLKHLERLTLDRRLGFNVELFDGSALHPASVYITNGYPTGIQDFPRFHPHHLHFPNCQLKDIEFVLERPEISEVDVSENRVSDVSPLAGLKWLTKCNLDTNPIRDLSPFAGNSTIQVLNLAATEVTDLSALRDLPLTELDLSHTPVEDLSPLASIKTLKSLNLSYSQVTDFSVISQLPNLQKLFCSGLQVEAIPVHQAVVSLNELDLSHTSVSDLSRFPACREIKLGRARGSPISHRFPNGIV